MAQGLHKENKQKRWEIVIERSSQHSYFWSHGQGRDGTNRHIVFIPRKFIRQRKNA
jgi:hypothetical protein